MSGEANGSNGAKTSEDRAPVATGGPKGPIRDVLRAPPPKRFYREATVAANPSGDGGYTVLLDARPLRTPAKNALVVPVRQVADMIAAEWSAQGERIDPATMHVTRIANSAIDGVASNMKEVAAEIAAFAGSDLLCYRAEAPAGLVALQEARWEPLLSGMEAALGARFVRAAGIVHVEQPGATLAKVADAVASFEPLSLAALHVLTTLSGSVLLALAVAHAKLAAAEAWSAAHADEDWQIAQWGEDAEAALRRRLREAEFMAAAAILDHIR